MRRRFGLAVITLLAVVCVPSGGGAQTNAGGTSLFAVAPTTDLARPADLRVTGSGLEPNEYFTIDQCVGSPATCDWRGQEGTADDSGNVDVEFRVRAELQPDQGTVDCGVESCFVSIRSSTMTSPETFPISFGPTQPDPPPVDPSTPPAHPAPAAQPSQVTPAFAG